MKTIIAIVSKLSVGQMVLVLMMLAGLMMMIYIGIITILSWVLPKSITVKFERDKCNGN